MYRVFLSFCFLNAYCNAESLHDFQKPFCVTRQNKTEQETEKLRVAIEIYKASKRKYTDPDGIWDQQYLKKHTDITNALREFSEKKRGQSLLKIHPERKTAASLHLELVKEGFTWKDVPLQSGQGKKYWLVNGDKTENEKNSHVIKMRIYTHKDGAIVRIKAAGIPDKTGKNPRRSPHVVMAVLKNLDSGLCSNDEPCNYDISYANEAFKITREGNPGPKGPSRQHGFRHPFPNKTSHARKLNQVAENAYMGLVHTNLETDCPEPWN